MAINLTQLDKITRLLKQHDVLALIEQPKIIYDILLEYTSLDHTQRLDFVVKFRRKLSKKYRDSILTDEELLERCMRVHIIPKGTNL